MAEVRSNTQEKLRLELAAKAIKLASEGRWSEAAKINRKIILQFPNDDQAYNRLGKALTENGNILAAKKAFKKSLEISPNNPIAMKNISRLSVLKHNNKSPTVSKETTKQGFVEDPGSTTVTSLIHLGPPKVVSTTSPGHQVKLVADKNILYVLEAGGETIGQIEPKLASKIGKIMSKGYKFEGTVTSVNEKISI